LLPHQWSGDRRTCWVSWRGARVPPKTFSQRLVQSGVHGNASSTEAWAPRVGPRTSAKRERIWCSVDWGGPATATPTRVCNVCDPLHLHGSNMRHGQAHGCGRNLIIIILAPLTNKAAFFSVRCLTDWTGSFPLCVRLFGHS
jgi:hypothetical protein